MAYFLSPIGNSQICDANGNPLNGGKIYTYLAGTTTPTGTATSNTGLVPQANPIILNSLGWSVNPIWMNGGVPLKFVIKDSADVTLTIFDNVTGVNDNTAAALDEWVAAGLTPTYVAATIFSVIGDQTLVLSVGRRVKTANTSGLIYSTITASSFSAGVTTVTVLNDSGVLDSGLAAVSMGFLSPTATSLPSSALVREVLGVNAVIGLKSIDYTFSANALTLKLNPTSISFRSTTLTSGAPVTVSNAAQLTTVISSGSTGGAVNAAQSDIILLAINNAGVIELAWTNLAGGLNLDETNLITTVAEGGAGAADSNNVIYSTTARTGVAYRVVGLIRSTQTVAGTWAQAPALVQPIGGQALAAMASFGFGQTWQDMSASRAVSTTYYNTTGKTIDVSVGVNATASSLMNVSINGSGIFAVSSASSAGQALYATFRFSPGTSYNFSTSNGATVLLHWRELR